MVPTVYDYGHDSDGHLFIAMELVEGGALADLIKSGRCRHSLRPPTQSASARSWREPTSSRQRSKANRTPAGSRGFETGHVLIGPSGAVKVLDFGIAKALAKTTQVTTTTGGRQPTHLPSASNTATSTSTSISGRLASFSTKRSPATVRIPRSIATGVSSNTPSARTRRANRCRPPAHPNCPPSSTSCSPIKWNGGIHTRQQSVPTQLFLAGEKPVAASGPQRLRRCRSDRRRRGARLRRAWLRSSADPLPMPQPEPQTRRLFPHQRPRRSAVVTTSSGARCGWSHS